MGKLQAWWNAVWRIRPREVPRDRCEHARRCHLCPRRACRGALNDRRDPDFRKPAGSGLASVLLHGKTGPYSMSIPMEAANRQAADRYQREHGHLPVDEQPPLGYDEQELLRKMKELLD